MTRIGSRIALLLSVSLALPLTAQSASMTGSLFMGNPSAGAVRHQLLVNTTVTTTGTGTARTIMLPANQWFMSGVNQRIFPAFPSVAQNTEVYSTSNPVATFGPGLGAGPISFCPQISPCAGFGQGTVAQGRVEVTPGQNTFGGAFRLLRHLKQGSGAWFITNPGTATPTKVIGFNANLRGVSATSMNVNPIQTPSGATVNTFSSPWTPGITNFSTVIDVNPVNLTYVNNFLSPSGAIQTLGTVAGFGTFDFPDGFATGFKMTTGVVKGSDATPPTTMGNPFTFSTAGYDNRDASGNGNIQMIGGGIAYGGVTGNVFFRITKLRMAVPEPGSLAALGAGVLAMGGLYGLRRRRS